jgi:hypothetical protein
LQIAREPRRHTGGVRAVASTLAVTDEDGRGHEVNRNSARAEWMPDLKSGAQFRPCVDNLLNMM